MVERILEWARWPMVAAFTGGAGICAVVWGAGEWTGFQPAYTATAFVGAAALVAVAPRTAA